MQFAVRVSKLLLLTAVSAALASVAQADPAERQAYYGDLHLHTSYSFDAYLLFGAQVDPDAAYRFARGESVEYLGAGAKRGEPLDFLAVTDHSENIGVFNSMDDPNSELSKSETGQVFKKDPVKAFFDAIQSGRLASGKMLEGVSGAKELSQSAWQREMEAANRNYRPGVFTTFIAYEYTSMPDGQNLHRNVIFRGDKAPNPFTSVDSPKPEDLWNWLDKIRKDGYEALAIPHNSNASNGLMFDWNDSSGRPIDQAYAEQRAADEPLVEIAQNKGASETHPALSPNDEFSNFEFYDHLLISPKKSKPEGSYVRDALGRGMEIAKRAGGVNPYKLGIVGASDFHNGLSTSSEAAFVGTFGGIDPTRPIPSASEFKDWSTAHKILSGSLYENSSGNLTAVWAEHNTRESIFDAFRRKETFATSGTRLKVRLFGGWEYSKAATKNANWVNTAYVKGVPMGSDLPVKPATAAGPRFIAVGVKDPNGANLDRLQIVKIWLQDGKHVERIYNLALSDSRKVDAHTGKAPAVGNTVDLKTATYKNSIGATQLSAVWQDPHFDPQVPAAYYLRLLEIPTPRWSTIVAVKRGEPLPSEVPAPFRNAPGHPRSGIRRVRRMRSEHMRLPLHRDPALRFLILGAMIFVAARWVEHTHAASAARIVIDGQLERRLSEQSEAQNGTAPTSGQLQQLVAGYVDDEILYREALRMGLDKDDEIIRRRLIQKVLFLQHDLAAAALPADGELRAYYESHPALFVSPPTAAFEQLFFSADRGGPAGAQGRAQQARERIANDDISAAKRLSDALPLQLSADPITRSEATRLFGATPVVDALFTTPEGRWSAPVRSGYGWHLIKVTRSLGSSRLAFELVRAPSRMCSCTWNTATERSSRNC